RTVALGAVAFVATLILLFGLANLLRPDRGGSGSAGPRTVGPSLAVAPSPSTGSSPSVGPSGAAPSGPGSPAASASTSSPGPIPSPSASGDPVLVGAGDIADCALQDDSATAALVEAIPGDVFTAGDNAYPDGTAAQFRDCYDPTWGRFRDRTRPAAGNHDWVTKGLAGYIGYFGAAAEPNGTSWYAYDLGTWHVVVLDSDCSSVGGCGADSPQGRWLAADLKASPETCTLAIWHHPRFSSGEHGNDTDVAPFWQALYAAGADVVINGHDHDYERFGPQDPTGQADPRGIREFVVGTGGAALRTFPTTAANSELRVATTHGVIRLVLHKASYEWSFIPTTGDLTDGGSAPCH
ncbi:MAG: hypothetical protein QOE42_2571, partial [Chloroflexota bacterium]|nr:hypothetical protein [Chloroflexota bacterium]